MGEGQIAQNPEEEQKAKAKPHPGRFEDQGKWLAPQFASGTPTADQRKPNHQKSIESQGLLNVSVKQVVHRPQRAASRTKQASHLVKHARGIKSESGWIKKVKNRRCC